MFRVAAPNDNLQFGSSAMSAPEAFPDWRETRRCRGASSVGYSQGAAVASRDVSHLMWAVSRWFHHK